MPYRNPVIPGFNPDPSVCRVGGDYYCTSSSFAWYPGLPIYHSRDLVNWRHIGYILDRPSQLPLQNPDTIIWNGIIAPTLRHHNGRFYCVCKNVKNTGCFIVSSEDASGAWSEPVVLEGEGWDNSIHFDEDGTCYYHWTSSDDDCRGCIKQYVLNPDTGERLSETSPIFYGTGEGGLEAPHLYKIDGRYFLVVAEGGTHFNHMVSIARGDSPWGPFEQSPHGPLLTHRHTQMNQVIKVLGHGDLVRAHDGSWWLLALGVRSYGWIMLGNHHLGRETFLSPVNWLDDGWPQANHGEDLQLEMDVPTLPLHPWPETKTPSFFNTGVLGLEWNFLRNPRPGMYSLTDNPGYLTLYGTEETLCDFNPCMIARRQTQACCSASVELEFPAGSSEDEAGLTVFMDERHHSEIFVRAKENRREAVVRRRVGTLVAETASADIPGDGPVTLRVEADPRWYRFGFSTGERDVSSLAYAEARHHSTEVAWGFTGVYLGMYAVGAEARFKSFDYDIQDDQTWIPRMGCHEDFRPPGNPEVDN